MVKILASTVWKYLEQQNSTAKDKALRAFVWCCIATCLPEICFQVLTQVDVDHPETEIIGDQNVTLFTCSTKWYAFYSYCCYDHLLQWSGSKAPVCAQRAISLLNRDYSKAFCYRRFINTKEMVEIFIEFCGEKKKRTNKSRINMAGSGKHMQYVCLFILISDLIKFWTFNSDMNLTWTQP